MKRRKGKIVQIIPIFIFLVCQFSSFHIKADENVTKNWTLSFESPDETNPAQLLLNITKSNSSHNISIQPSRDDDKEYKISAVLLYMTVQDGFHEKNEFSSGVGSRPAPFPVPSDPKPPSIRVSNSKGINFEHSGYYNYTEDSFNYPEVSEDTFVSVTSDGVWKDGAMAQIILTAYYEATSCYSCSPDEFCCHPAQGCEDTDSKIDLTVSDDGHTRVIQLTETIHEISMKQKQKQQQSRNAGSRRCIPDVLKCNGVPNCGHYCNHDESDEVCHPGDPWACPSYECYWDMSFVWTALLAIIFFVISPTVVVFLICYHRQLTVVTRRRRHGGSDSSIVVHSPPNDLPPTYDELHGGLEEPPPCFCRATSMIDDSNTSNSNGSNGFDNPTFYPDDSMTVQKSGSISISVIECSCKTSNSSNNNNDSDTTVTTTPANGAEEEDKTESQNPNPNSLRNPRETITMTIPTTTTPFKSQHDNPSLESQNNNNNSSNNIDNHV